MSGLPFTDDGDDGWCSHEAVLFEIFAPRLRPDAAPASGLQEYFQRRRGLHAGKSPAAKAQACRDQGL